MREFETLSKINEVDFCQYSDKFLAKRLVFLWDLRDNDYELYKKNSLVDEKEGLYRYKNGAITTLASQL